MHSGKPSRRSQLKMYSWTWYSAALAPIDVSENVLFPSSEFFTCLIRFRSRITAVTSLSLPTEGHNVGRPLSSVKLSRWCQLKMAFWTWYRLALVSTDVSENTSSPSSGLLKFYRFAQLYYRGNIVT
jgi:hypothetical protein